MAWLGCLGSEAGALGVLCEGLEDIVVVKFEGRVFAQLKTRTRGSWSTAKVRVDGRGLDSLARAHILLDRHLSTDTFELWLEGHAGAARETLDFFNAPLTATVATRKQLQKHGLKSLETNPSDSAQLDIAHNRPMGSPFIFFGVLFSAGVNSSGRRNTGWRV